MPQGLRVLLNQNPAFVRKPRQGSRRGCNSDSLVIPVPGRQHLHMSSITSLATEPSSVLPGTMEITSPTPIPRAMSIDALRGMDMFFIVGMEEVFEALSEMFPMTPSLNDRLQHAPWAGFHFYDLIFPL